MIKIAIPAPMRSALSRALSLDGVRTDIEDAIAEAAERFESDLRGPTPNSPGIGLPAGRRRAGRPQNPLAPGLGLVPINTGRLLSSHDIVHDGLTVRISADARDPGSGFEYADVAHHSGEPVGDSADRVGKRFLQFGEEAIRDIQVIITRQLSL